MFRTRTYPPMMCRRFLRLAIALLLDMSTSLAKPQQPFDLDGDFRAPINEQYLGSVLPLSDGKVLIAGTFIFPGDNPGIPRSGARLLPNGENDPNFQAYPGMGGKLTAWNDRFYSGAGQSVRRLNMDGSYDPDFILMNSGPYFGSLQGGDYHVYPDGRVLMSGAHTLDDPTRGFVGLYSLIWFSNEGYLDTTRTHRYCDEVIFEIEEQPGGKFLCSGTMNSYEGQPVNGVFRIEPDGVLDITFNADIGSWGEAFVFETLSDDRILVGGVFQRSGSTDTLGLARLLPDGSWDGTFHSPLLKANFTPFQSLAYILDILPMPDGKLIITGRFDEVDGQVRGGIAMLDADGNLLNDAFAGDGCGLYNYNGTLYKGISGITPAPDGSYYIYGAYHGYDDGTTNDTEQRMVSRLYGLDVGMRERQEEPRISVFPNPCTSSFELRGRMRTSNSSLILLDAMGRIIRTWPTHPGQQTFSTSGIAPGNYIVRYSSDATHSSTSLLIVP